MKAERDYLLHHYYGGSATGRRPPSPPRIREDDYRAVPTPMNLPFPLIAGNCLIWRWGLNGGGYGVLTINGEQKLAHRVAYEQANKPLHQGANVLHFCHRPACVQPAHLYLGDDKENAEDRKARFGKAGLLLLDYVSDRFKRAGTTVWSDPTDVAKQLTLEPPPATECPGHNFRIPAGDTNLCTICGEFPNSDFWKDVEKKFKCPDPKTGSSYTAHRPAITEWPPQSVHCARCGQQSDPETGEKVVAVVEEDMEWFRVTFEDMQVIPTARITAGPYTGIVHHYKAWHHNADGVPDAWDIQMDSDDGIEVLVTNGGRFLNWD